MTREEQRMTNEVSIEYSMIHRVSQDSMEYVIPPGDKKSRRNRPSLHRRARQGP